MGCHTTTHYTKKLYCTCILYREMPSSCILAATSSSAMSLLCTISSAPKSPNNVAVFEFMLNHFFNMSSPALALETEERENLWSSLRVNPRVWPSSIQDLPSTRTTTSKSESVSRSVGEGDISKQCNESKHL